MGRGPSARLGNTGRSHARKLPVHTRHSKKKELRLQLVTFRVCEHSEQGHNPHGLSPVHPALVPRLSGAHPHRQAVDTSAPLQPHAWAANQAIPTLGTKRPLSASGPFPRPLLVPLLLCPLLFSPGAERNQQGEMWSDFRP